MLFRSLETWNEDSRIFHSISKLSQPSQYDLQSFNYQNTRSRLRDPWEYASGVQRVILQCQYKILYLLLLIINTTSIYSRCYYLLAKSLDTNYRHCRYLKIFFVVVYSAQVPYCLLSKSALTRKKFKNELQTYSI